MISIIHPSRGRPEKAFKTSFDWINGAGCEIEYSLILDTSDTTISRYGDLFKAHQYFLCDGNSAVHAINFGAKISSGSILIVVSDDTEPVQNWVQLIKNSVGSKTDWILKTQDGTQPWIITMPIMDRAYYNRFGYIYNPGYQHMFCDTELTCVADLTGRKITSNILFKHNHYSVTKEPRDAVSIKADSTWDQGEKLFLERYKRNFDLPPDQIKGKILDNGMINWLQRKV